MKFWGFDNCCAVPWSVEFGSWESCSDIEGDSCMHGAAVICLLAANAVGHVK